MVPVFMLFYGWYRSLNDPDEESRTRRRMVGDDVDFDDALEDERFSEAQSQWSASGHPVLARRLADLSVKVGARARFLVEVSSPSPVSVRWEKDGRTVDESDRISMVTEGNFHCLDISPVCQEDGGLWRVKVTNIIGTAMSSAQLTLLVPKAYKKPEFVEPLRAVLTAQGTVSLECKVIGVPTPLLRWFKGSNEIKAGDVLALTPNASDPTSLGSYTCLASNCMGTVESTSVVHIDGSPAAVQGFLPTGPKPIFAKELRNEKVKLGGSITLECKVTVPPWPEAVNWYGPNGEIVETNRTHIIEDGAGMYSLKIANVTAEDNGTWKCVATNKHGAKAMSTCLISVSYPKNYRKPKFLESLKAVLTEEGLVSFECKVVGYPTPNLSWFKDGQELKPGDVYQLTGTNSLGSYSCIARNCMGEAQSSAELTLEDIKSQLSEEEKIQLSSEKLPPRFITGLKSSEAKINESLKLSVKVSVFPEPTIIWFRDDEVVSDGDRYKIEKDKLGGYHILINKLEFCDQAEWKVVATNDYGQSVTSCFVKLNIPKHFKKPKFLEDLKAVMSEEGAVNLECKVIGVPQPKLKWFKDGKELKPGDIHKIISGQDGTCCLGTYTCLAQNCMGSVSSSASLLGFEEKGEKSTGVIPDANRNGQALSRDRSLSTIHEERTSQLHDTDKSTTIDDRAEEVSFSFDGKEVSVSLYETPDLTEEEALQIVEMYADQISEHVTERNVVELPPMRFTKESSTSGKLLMEAVVIDVSPEYFSSTHAPRKPIDDDLRTDAELDEFSLVEELNTANLSPDRNLSPIENLTLDKISADFAEKTPPSKPPRTKNKERSVAEDKTPAKDDAKSEEKTIPKRRGKKKSTDSEKEDDSLQEFERRKNLSSQKQQSERKRTDSELEDDSLYEFESRKMKEDVFKSFKEDEPQKYSTETGVPRTSDNESQFYSPLKSPVSVASKMTEDEGTFDTAEDSAFDKSEMSVLETLAHSLHEIQKNLTAVEAHVSESSAEMQSAQGISECLVEPLAEVQKSLEIVEAQIQDFPTGKYSSEVLETLIQPITKFKENLALLEQKSLPSILESVAGPLEELNREISFIQRATQSQIEYAKSVEEVQESLTKIIERQASVPSDRKLLDSISSELEKLEEKANDDLEVYYDRLLTVGTELRSKANDEEDQEIQDILKAVGDLVKPLKRLTAVTSKCIAVIVEDNQLGNIPSKKIVESLLKPLDALEASLSLLESVSMLKSHKTIRGAGIPILYKVSVPMEELETTIKLVENLSAHSAVEFLIPPLDNLIKVVNDIDVSKGGDGFLEDLQGEGTPIVKSLDDSLDIMLSCINSIDKGVSVIDSERGIPGKLPALLKPMEDLQKSLKSVEKGILSKSIDYEAVYEIAQELSKPLQSIRSEFSILQHEIEADHYSTEEPSRPQSAVSTLVEPLEGVQNCISAFHETIMCKSADDPMHMRLILYALKELSEPLSSLSSKMIKAEEVLLGKGDPFQGLKAVARSVSELRESSSAVTSQSNVIEQISNILSQPLFKVQNGLENILQEVDKKDKQVLNKNLLKSMDAPFQELQSALLEIEGNIDENVTEGVTPELRQAVQELQNRISTIQNQNSFDLGDEASAIEANVETLQSLTQPLQTLHAQFTEVQRSNNRTMIKAERAITSLKDSTRRVSTTISEMQLKRTSGKPSCFNLLQMLGTAVKELEAAVEDAQSHLGRGKRVDETRRVLANTLKVASAKLGEVCFKADDLSISVEPNKRKSLVLVQDFIHNLKVAIEQSTRVVDCDRGTAVERSRDTLIAIEQLASAMSSFHDQLMTVDEFTSVSSAPQGMIAMKDHVDKLQKQIEVALSSDVKDKNDKMILETIENDVKSVQRVLDNLLSEDASDNARVRFILTKAESIHSDLKDMAKSIASSAPLKTACQAALSVIDIGQSMMNRKSPMRMEIISQVEPEPELSVIGELLENMDELDRCFNKLKREPKIKVHDKEVAEIAMEIATLQAMVQDLATQASGELLDKAVEVCIPIKAIEVKLSQTKNLTASDLEEASESLHNINHVLNGCIRKKESEKLMQPSTSIIGELLENVGDLEACFDRLKRAPLPNDTTESQINDIGREILALQNIVDDLTSEATGELLDRAQEICIPIKSIETSLKHHAVLTKDNICEAKDKLKAVNHELLLAIRQNEIDKQNREKDFEKLFSSESLSTSVDVPIVKSIVTTIEYMQAHLKSLVVPQEMEGTRTFLEKFELGLVEYGESLMNNQNDKLSGHMAEMESALLTADATTVEVKKLIKAVNNLKSSNGDISKALPALQSILSPLKTLHEELSRPNSPKRLKKAELQYLESFSKSSTDLELGLMKLEKALISGTQLDAKCMATPIEQLVSFIDGIAHEPIVKELGDESSLTALHSLAQPIEVIQTMIFQVEQAVREGDKSKAATLIKAIAKPVRELRTNIALIQDQAMMNCSLSQLDELKQAVALMTQVGTETPSLKQPLLQLQARLQELEPEAELAEVVNELTGPVDALKQAVIVLETKGENSLLLELCHQVVDIIHRSDDTLSEMSSLGPQSTRADVVSGMALLKVATLCHDLMEDHSITELSHTDDTLTATHADEQLPSLHGAAIAEQGIALEQVRSIKDSSITLQKAEAKPGSIAGQLKVAMQGHEVADDQTLSEMSDINNLSVTIASEKLSAHKETIKGEQKIALEGVESFEEYHLSATEADERKVQAEHVNIGTAEPNVQEDHTLSDLSPNENTNSGTFPIEKSTSVRETAAIEEKLALEQVGDLNVSLASTKEAAVGQTSISSKIVAAKAGLVGFDDQSAKELSVSSASATVASPKLVDLKEAALAQEISTLEQTDVLAESDVSSKEAHIEDVSERLKAEQSTLNVQLAPSEVSIVTSLLEKEIKTVGCLKNAVTGVGKLIDAPQILKEKLHILKGVLQYVNSVEPICNVIGEIHDFIDDLKQATLSEQKKVGQSQVMDLYIKFVEAVQKQEELEFGRSENKLKDVAHLLDSDKLDVHKLKKAINVLQDIPPIKEMSIKNLQKCISTLSATIEEISPLAKPEEILNETKVSISQLKTVISQIENDQNESEVLKVCKGIVNHVGIGEKNLLSEATGLLQDSSQDVTKFKKAVSIVHSIPLEDGKYETAFSAPLSDLKSALDQLGPLTKPEQILHQIVEPVNSLYATIKEIEKTQNESKILEVCKLIIKKADCCKQLVKEEVMRCLKNEDLQLSSMKKAIAVISDFSKSEQKYTVISQPLIALQGVLDQVSSDTESKDLFRIAREPIERLEEIVSAEKKINKKSELLEICEMLIEKSKIETGSLQKEVAKLLEGEMPKVQGLQRAVALMIDVPLSKPQKIDIRKPLVALQAKLESIGQHAEPLEILRATMIPVRELKAVVTDLRKTGEKSQLIDVCEMIIQKTEDTKEALQNEAQKLLKSDSQDVSKLQKAVAILVDLPKDAGRKFSVVNEPLAALRAKLDLLPQTAKPEEILRCTLEPVKALKQVLSDVSKKGEKSQLLEICQQVVEKTQLGKTAMQEEVKTQLKGAQSTSDIKKAIATLVEIPNEDMAKAELITQPLIAIQAKLESIGPSASPVEILRGTIEPVRQLKQVITDLQKTGQRSELIEICKMVIEKTEQGKEVLTQEVSKMLLEGGITNADQLQKAVAMMIDVPKNEQNVEEVQKPLVALKAKLDGLKSDAQMNEVLKCAFEPIIALKQTINDVETKVNKSQVLEVCHQLLGNVELSVNALKAESKKILKSESLTAFTLEKVVGNLVAIPKFESHEIKSIKVPLLALQAKLEHVNPAAETVEILKCAAEDVSELKHAVTDLKKSGEKSEIVELCELLIQKTEQCTEAVHEEAGKLLKCDALDASSLQKAVALLAVVPKEKELNISVIEKPLLLLRGKLDKLNPSATPEEIVRITVEPMRLLEARISEVKKSGEKSKLLDVCELVVEKVEQNKKALLLNVAELLKGELTNISDLKKAVATLVEVPKGGQRAESVEKPLEALQAKLENLGGKADSIDIVRGTREPVQELKQALVSLENSGEKSQLFDVCQQVIEKVEEGKSAMENEAAKLLKAEIREVEKLKKAVALLVDVPKSSQAVMTAIEQPLSALQSKLNNLIPSSTPQDILRCSMEPLQILHQSVVDLKKKGEKGQLLEACDLLVQKIDQCKEVMEKEAYDLLKSEKLDISTLEKAVAILVDVTKGEQKAKIMTEPLAALQAKLNTLGSQPTPEEIVRCTAVPVKLLKGVISEINENKQNHSLAQLANIIVDKIGRNVQSMKDDLHKLIEGDLKEVTKLRKAVALLVDLPMDEKEEKTEINKQLVILQSKLAKIPSDAKPEEIVKGTSESVAALQKAVLTAEASGEKLELADLCRKVVTHLETGKAKEKTLNDIEKMISIKVKTIFQLHTAVETLSTLNTTCETLQQPFNDLLSTLTFLHKNSNIDDFIADLMSPMKNLKKTASSLDKVSVQNDVLQTTLALINHLEPLFNLEKLEQDEKQKKEQLELKRKQEAEERKKELERNAKIEEEEKAKKLIEEEENRNKLLLEEKKKKELEMQKVEQEKKLKLEQEEKKKNMEEEKKRKLEEEEQKNKSMEEEKKRKQEQEEKEKLEEEKKRKQEEEKRKQEQEEKKKLEEEKQRKQEEEKRKQEQEEKKKLEEEKKRKQEEEKRKQEEEKRKQEQEEKKKLEEEKKRKQEEEAKQRKIEEEKKRKQEEEEKKKKKEEEEKKLKQEEEDKKKKTEEEKKRRQELEERKKMEEEEAKKKKMEEEERLKQEREEKEKMEIEKKRKQEEEEKKKKMEEEEKKKKMEEEEKKKKMEEEEKLKQKEEEKMKKVEVEKKIKQEREEKEKVEEEEKRKQEEEEKKKKMEEEKKIGEEKKFRLEKDKEIEQKEEEIKKVKLEHEAKLKKENEATQTKKKEKEEVENTKLQQEEEKKNDDMKGKEYEDKIKLEEEDNEKQETKEKKRKKVEQSKLDEEKKKEHDDSQKKKLGDKSVKKEEESQLSETNEKVVNIKKDEKGKTEEEKDKLAKNSGRKLSGEVAVENASDEEKSKIRKKSEADGATEKQGLKSSAEVDKQAREKQSSLSYVEELIRNGITLISQLKKAVEILSLYKNMTKPLAKPLENLDACVGCLYEKSPLSDFVPDLLQPMSLLKIATDSVVDEESGLVLVSKKLIEHLEPILGLKAFEQKEKKKLEFQKLKLEKEEEGARAKASKLKEEEVEKERIDAEMRQAKAKAKEQEEMAEKQKAKDDKRTESLGNLKDGKKTKATTKETKQKQETLLEGKSEKLEASKKELEAENRKMRKQQAVEEAEKKEIELKEARERERKLREEKLLKMQQEREKLDEEDRVKREQENVARKNRQMAEKEKLDKEKEEVEMREKNIKAKLEQVKKEKRDMELEEQNRLVMVRKQERERQEQEAASRKEKEEARAKAQQEKDAELRQRRIKELERREAELENIRSRESLRSAHLDDLQKREVSKCISKSLDAMHVSSLEKLHKSQMEYSASVTTMTTARDTGVHSTRGISVVELLDYQPPPVRPERTKRSIESRRSEIDRKFAAEATISKWDRRLADLSPDTRRRPKEISHFTQALLDSHPAADMPAYTWDRSKEQNWKHLEYPTPDYESPLGYHRSRRSISPMREFGSSTSLGGTRFQAAPQQHILPQHRARRSLSPMERSLIQPYSGSTTSLTSIGSRKHMDELTSARIRPPTPTRAYLSTRSRSITKENHRAYIVNGLVDKTVIHGGKIRLSCNIGGDPNPSIEWMKDGKLIAYHTEASRYKTECNYGVACLEVSGARLSDAGQYTCVVKNVDGQSATTCTVRVALNDDDDKEWESIENELDANMPREVCLSIKGAAFGMPRVTGLVADPVVPSGGTIAVHVQVAGCHLPEVTWLHKGAPLPKYSPRVHYFEDGGLFTLLLEGATPSESGVYTCRVSGRGRGAIDTTTTVQVVERRGHEKPAIFTARPETRMALTAGDDMTLTCYISGEPRPQVMIMKGIKDITTSCRMLKECFGEYVRLTLKRVNLEDRGTYFIIAKNIYGTDRTFVTLEVRERARSMTPPSWSERTSSLSSLFKETHRSTPSWRSAANLHSSFSSLYE